MKSVNKIFFLAKIKNDFSVGFYGCGGVDIAPKMGIKTTNQKSAKIDGLFNAAGSGRVPGRVRCTRRV